MNSAYSGYCIISHTSFLCSLATCALPSMENAYLLIIRRIKEPTALLEKSRGISPVLEACPLSDALITRIPADEEPLCGNAAVYSMSSSSLLLLLLLLLLSGSWTSLFVTKRTCYHMGTYGYIHKQHFRTYTGS